MYINIIITIPATVLKTKSCSVALHASFGFLLPKYCPATTAPPVAKAANILISKTLTESTRETADIAASPTLDTISESASPTVTANNCSIINGIINFLKSCFENNISITLSYIYFTRQSCDILKFLFYDTTMK